MFPRNAFSLPWLPVYIILLVPGNFMNSNCFVNRWTTLWFQLEDTALLISTLLKICGVTINWIHTQFWSTSRGNFDKNKPALIAYTFEGVSFNWIMTFSMPWGVTINWNMSSNWNQSFLPERFKDSSHLLCKREVILRA